MTRAPGQERKGNGKTWNGSIQFWRLHNVGSRREVGALVRRGAVTVNGLPVKKPDVKIDPERDAVCVNGTMLSLHSRVVLMMNKPAGVLSASRDARAETVVDLLPAQWQRRGLFPAGRLDKDTRAC